MQLNADYLTHRRSEKLIRRILPCSRQGLPLPRVTTKDCGLLPHSFHLCPAGWRGSLVSVALSLRLLSVAVSNCRSLRCPDFPPRRAASRIAHPCIIAKNTSEIYYELSASKALLTSASAALFSSRGT